MYGKGLGQQKKTGTRRAAVFLKSVLGQGLLDALFGKARAYQRRRPDTGITGE